MADSDRTSTPSHHRIGAVLITALLLVVGTGQGGLAPADAADDGTRTHWQGEHSIYWADGQNWSDGVPGPDDTAVIDLASQGDCAGVEAGSVTVKALELTVCGNLYATSLTAERVTVAGASLLRTPTTVTDEMVWTGGTLVYEVTVPVGATMISSGTGERGAYSLTIHGALVLDGGTTTVVNSGVTSDGLIRVDATSRLAGAGPLLIGGTLDVGSSTLMIDGPSLLTSGETSLTGGSLELVDGAHEFLAGARFVGDGQVRQSGGPTGATLKGHGSLALDPDVRLEIAGGQELGQLLVQGGRLVWSGGALVGVVTVGVDTLAEVSGDNPKSVYGELVNLGRMTWGAGSPIEIYNDGIRNEGKVIVAEDVVAEGGGRFSSSGTVRLLRAGLVVDGPSFECAGRVQLSAGTLRLKSGFHHLADGAELLGTGEVVAQSEVTAEGRVALGEEVSFVLAGGALRGTFNAEGGTVRWTRGPVWADLGVGAGTTLLVSGTAAKEIVGFFVNDGIVRLAGGPLTLSNGLLNRGTVSVAAPVRLKGVGVVNNARAGRILLAAKLTVAGPGLMSYGRVALGRWPLSLGAGAHVLKGSSVLATTVNGATTRAGQITGSGTLALDGRVLVAEAVRPLAKGTRVTLLTAQSRTGAFASVRGLGVRAWAIRYTTTSAVLRAR